LIATYKYIALEETMKTQSRNTYVALLLICLLLPIGACNDDDAVTDPVNTTTALTVKVQADYGAAKMSPLLKRMLAATCPEPAPLTDDPSFAAGWDCDQDGGVVTFATPSNFTVAIKKLDIIRDDGEVLEVISDTGTLAASDVNDLSNTVTLFTDDIEPGTFPTLDVVFYYYELTMMINDPPSEETIRVYLSDDDFPAEGNLGHHQGDITIIGADGTEYGWAAGCATWNAAGALDTRGNIMGAGGLDPETGHARGLYGDTAQWNQSDFMQGADQDLFSLSGDLGLTLSDEARTVTITFDVMNTWFFEDFDDNQLFNPGEGAEACSANSEWTPIFPDINITTQ
jgi:hypothetical protein